MPSPCAAVSLQGVHQVFEGTPDRKWLPDEPRVSRMVFIGKYMHAEDFQEAFEACLVKTAVVEVLAADAPATA